MRTVKKVANSYNCESLELANPSFLSLENRGLANPSKVANREQCESLRAPTQGPIQKIEVLMTLNGLDTNF